MKGLNNIFQVFLALYEKELTQFLPLMTHDINTICDDL